jgi:hypothetical protein
MSGSTLEKAAMSERLARLRTLEARCFGSSKLLEMAKTVEKRSAALREAEPLRLLAVCAQFEKAITAATEH